MVPVAQEQIVQPVKTIPINSISGVTATAAACDQPHTLPTVYPTSSASSLRFPWDFSLEVELPSYMFDISCEHQYQGVCDTETLDAVVKSIEQLHQSGENHAVLIGRYLGFVKRFGLYKMYGAYSVKSITWEQFCVHGSFGKSVRLAEYYIKLSNIYDHPQLAGCLIKPKLLNYVKYHFAGFGRDIGKAANAWLAVIDLVKGCVVDVHGISQPLANSADVLGPLVQEAMDHILEEKKAFQGNISITRLSSLSNVSDVVRVFPRETPEANQPHKITESNQSSGSKQAKDGSRTNPWFSQRSHQWWSPLYILCLIKKLLGSIDLDPFSCDMANLNVGATHYFDGVKHGCGFRSSWLSDQYKTIVINPPRGKLGKYSRSDLALRKLVSTIVKSGWNKTGVAELKASLGYKWVKNWIKLPHAILKDRVHFIDGDGSASKKGQADPQATVIVYIGKDLEGFYNTFKEIAWIPGINCFAAGTTFEEVKHVASNEVDEFPYHELRHWAMQQGCTAQAENDGIDDSSCSGGSESGYETQ